LGHRKIAIINGQYHSGVHSARLERYLQFFKAKNLPVKEEWMISCFYNQENGYDAALGLFGSKEPPTAIFAANDILAIGALQALTDKGIAVPEAVSLIGMDDIYPASITTPPLTTVAKCKYEEGWEAAQFLIQRINGKKDTTSRRLTFPPRLIIRKSTAPPSRK
jgi:LacI family transcriptional regulator